MAAKKNAGTVAAGTATGATADPNATTTPTPSTPRDPANQLYWNEDRKIALLSLVYQNQGTLTAGQVAQQLAAHPVFADQADLLANGTKIGEKIRSQVKKLATEAVKRGRPEPKLRRGAGGRSDLSRVFDAIFGPVTASVQAQTAAPIQQLQPQPIATPIQAPGPVPVIGGGLISIPG